MWLTNTKTGKPFNTDWTTKEQNIKQNQKESTELNKALKDEPVNLIGKCNDKQYRKTAQNTGDKRYNELYDYLTDKILNNIDTDKPEEVVKVVVDYFNKNGIKGYSCYSIAGGVAAVLEKKKIPYKCFNGCATSKKELNKSKPNLYTLQLANHTWIESNGKRYEYYSGRNNNDLVHLSKTSEIKFNRKVSI